MEKIIWTDKFSVGHDKLDTQHQVIIDLINKLIDQKENFERDAVRAIISDLVKYGLDHLKYEENLLQDKAFDDLVKHRHEHFLYVQQATRYMKDTDKVDLKRLEEITEFLQRWWTLHILEEDMKYVDCLQAQA